MKLYMFISYKQVQLVFIVELHWNVPQIWHDSFKAHTWMNITGANWWKNAIKT